MIKSVVETEDHTVQGIDLGAWKALVTFSSSAGRSAQQNVQPIGKAMIVQLGENEFVLIGTLSRFTFRPLGTNSGRAWQYLKVEEGRYENGDFKLLRILNGDETDAGGPRIGATPRILRVTLTVRLSD